eukprot:GEMP01047649.1.p1 GENE.GEMP01047649.1~~GEMP01047649.1.p1  ORF type:complete len:282 (+),score=48.98 GEMP01047649.1:6-851(+)
MGSCCSVERSDLRGYNAMSDSSEKAVDTKSAAWKSRLSPRGSADGRIDMRAMSTTRLPFLPPRSGTSLFLGHELRSHSDPLPIGYDAARPYISPRSSGSRVLAPSPRQLSVDSMSNLNVPPWELAQRSGMGGVSRWCCDVRVHFVDYMKDMVFDPTDNAEEYSAAITLLGNPDSKSLTNVDVNSERDVGFAIVRHYSPTSVLSASEGYWTNAFHHPTQDKDSSPLPLLATSLVGERTPSPRSVHTRTSPRSLSPSHSFRSRLPTIARTRPLQTVHEGDEKP